MSLLASVPLVDDLDLILLNEYKHADDREGRVTLHAAFFRVSLGECHGTPRTVLVKKHCIKRHKIIPLHYQPAVHSRDCVTEHQLSRHVACIC